MRVRAVRDNILCTDGDFGEQTTQSGIIIQKTIGKDEGIHPRWFRVFDVGPDIAWCKPGQWLYVEYGRWTDSVVLHDDRFDNEDHKEKVWKVDPNACLMIADGKPADVTLGQYTTFKPSM